MVIGAPPASLNDRSAAIGAARLAGRCSVAPVRNTGRGMICVRIESALIPGSNTPSPPGSQIHACPGCHTRTSSRQVIATLSIRRSASHAFAGATPAAKRECHAVNSDAPTRSACASNARTSLMVAPGGFSRNTCTPARKACAARR